MPSHVDVFMPSRRRIRMTTAGLGALKTSAVKSAPTVYTSVRKQGATLTAWNPAGAQKGIVDTMVDLGPIAIVGAVLGAAVVGYIVVTKVL